ncbi:uncharacterized protein LOC118564030 [Fundulus heteroclitus]|uniref:uncharacterized protein LOC118564030 n=1 Tax=Fundulus heteroclitus TaxID=8078 RepID=UPI00165BB6F9|nr:uncharacterized protein LOC118564030 [Fundulus heteroclitus]
MTIRCRPATRRGILSTVSSVYDPLGLLSPFILKAKQLLQELCKSMYGWDHVIPQEFAKAWQRWVNELNMLHDFQVPRCMKPENFDPVETAELHHFCDASESGYGTVSYLRLSNHQGQIHICFIFGKARVAPLKQMTIPRLELTAATLAVKVDRMLKKELHLPLSDLTFWTDSTSVLKYIHNQTKRFHTFVSNRIAIIHDLSHTSQWRYVSSKVNPADDAARGLYVESFLRSKWLTGPEYLNREKRTWLKHTEGLKEIPANDPEVRKEITAVPKLGSDRPRGPEGSAGIKVRRRALAPPPGEGKKTEKGDRKPETLGDQTKRKQRTKGD